FTAPRGGQIHYANFFHRRWLPALRAAMSCPAHPRDRDEPGSTCDCPGVLRRRPTPHDLRHTHAAWLFSDPRVTPLAISRRLGHAQLATTSEIYGDLLPEAEGATIAALDDALGG